jgi:hypothetical protein
MFSRRSAFIPMAVAVLSLVPLTGFAGEKKDTVGRISAGATQVEWQIGVDNEKVMLTVVGPEGVTYEKAFPAGKNPALRMQDGPNKTLPDGSYTYELRVIPRISPDVKKKLSDARAKGDEAEISNILRAAGITNTTLQSGGFRISGGSFVSSDASEPSAHDTAAAAATKKATAGVSTSATKGKIATNDDVIADDLIVQGSACIGLDCANGESFGFDTLRLKENNTRIKFDDTSTGTGFPATDWQLTANDSASGGLNKFSIEDVTTPTVPFTIEGAAPTNSLYVDSTGFIGLGTAAPLLLLHESKGDTPAIRLEQTNVSGFTAQTWDIGANEANWFVRDLTGGSRLPFRIRPGAPTSAIDIAASGNVGFGTASPNSLYGKIQVFATNPGMLASFGTDFVPLTMYHNAARAALFYNAYNDGSDRIFFGSNRAASSEFNVSTGVFSIKTSTAGGASGTVTTLTDRISIDNAGNIGLNTTATTAAPITHSSGATLSTGGVWTNASSRALKQDIRELPLDAAKSALDALNPVTYEYKIAPTEHHVGFIAEDVPELVATQDRKGLSSMDVVAVLTKVVQDQQKTIDTLSQRIEQLEKGKQ